MSKRLGTTMCASENSLHIIFNPLFINGICKINGPCKLCILWSV